MTLMLVVAAVYSAAYLGYCDYKDAKKELEAKKEAEHKHLEELDRIYAENVLKKEAC